jgi:hypothetical protein
MKEEETKQQQQHDQEEEDDDVCRCGLYLDASSTESFLGKQPQPQPQPQPPGSTKATCTSMDASFVHLPAHLQYNYMYQPAAEEGGDEDFMHSNYYPAKWKRLVPFLHATSSAFLDTAQHLGELHRAAHSGGEGVHLCADCISR